MRRALLTLLALLLLAGCTGTQPDPVPVVLAVGVSAPSGGEIQLYSQLIEQDVASTQPIEEPIEGGVIPLGDFNPVALDVSDSASSSLLAALVSDGSAFELRLFDLSDVRVDQAPDFSSATRVELPVPETADGCFTDVAVSEQRVSSASHLPRYVAVFDEGCPGDAGVTIPDVIVYELSGTGAVDATDSVAARNPTENVAPFGMSVEGNSIYYADDRATEGLGVARVTFQQIIETTDDPERFGTVSDFDLFEEEDGDIALVAGGVAVISDGELGLFNVGEGSGTNAVDTRTTANRLMEDPRGSVAFLVSWAGSELWVVAFDELGENRQALRTTGSITDVVLEPTSRFAYAVHQGGIWRLDLLSGSGAREDRYPIEWAGTPTAVTLTYAFSAGQVDAEDVP